MTHTIQEIIGRIDSIPALQGKVVYDHFTTPVNPPFAAYYYTFNTSGADDYNAIQWIDFTLEIYSDPRDIALETTVVKALIDFEIDAETTFISNENMYCTTLTFTFINKLNT